MKKLMIAAACIFLPALGLNAQYGTNWMHNVKSWDVMITLTYKDSANPGNFTNIQLTAKGKISNEMMPAGGRMSWPLTQDPSRMKQLLAKGTFAKKVTEDMPEPNRIEDYSCSANINEQVLGALATGFNNTYVINLQMPEIPQITCSGKGAPVSEDNIRSLNRDNGIEPPEGVILGGDCGTERHTLQGRRSYTTTTGARVTISWVYTPLAGN